MVCPNLSHVATEWRCFPQILHLLSRRTHALTNTQAGGTAVLHDKLQQAEKGRVPLSPLAMRAESEDGGRQRKSFPAEELRGRRSRRSLFAAGRTPAGHHQGDGASQLQLFHS